VKHKPGAILPANRLARAAQDMGTIIISARRAEDMENVHSQSMGGITQSLEAVLIVKVA
jgi:hypothetical protein